MHQGLRTLDELPIGESAVVHRVACQRRVGRRLMEMGLLPGTRIEMVRRAPLGDPLEVRLRGYLLSLRRAEASGVSLAADGHADLDPDAGVGRDAPAGPGRGAGAADDARSGAAAPARFAAHPPRSDRTAPVPRVLVAGNANSGKTTIFNALTGARARVGNYPGVTVTRASRQISLPGDLRAEVVDLPGTYSLSTHSLDEQVAVDEVLGRRGDLPDAVVVVVDACALERGLYLVLQIVETGVPVVVALNMVDEAAAAGITVDAAKLGDWLGVEAVPTVASAGDGFDALHAAIGRSVALALRSEAAGAGLPARAETAVAEVERSLDGAPFVRSPAGRRSWAIWSLLSHTPDADDDDVEGLPPAVRQRVDDVRRTAAGEGVNLDEDLIAARYRWIETVVRDVRRTAAAAPPAHPWTDRIDSVLTHRVYGMAVFAVVMALLFEALFTWSEPFIGAIEGATAALQSGITTLLPAGPLEDLMVNGVIAGVGNVVVFVPQIAMLFLFIAILEDFGYLARVAFVIDRLMGRIGLHGKAFVPMLSGFACAIPAVMATRTIESRRDRLITMLTLPMISCSARLPVYALVTAVVFAGDARVFGLLSAGAVVLFSMYALSVAATLGAAAVLRRTVLHGPRLPLVLELPPYRMPVWRNVGLVAWRGLRKFLVDAGTIILTMTIILWALLSYPRSAEIEARYESERNAIAASVGDPDAQAERIAELNGREAGEALEYSVAGRLGRIIEPTIEPLGFDWRIGVGILGAFAAREVFVSTLGIVFGIAEADEESPSLRASLAEARHEDGSPLMTPLAGVSLMVFFVLACQCMSTIGVVRRESGSWRWPIFMFAYMSVLAYGASLVVYQAGTLLGWGI
ncbi:MAG: ferrous iron transport protein B [Acidobacteria bacterium]|nr:ferrous iron transport protein B [Acidobacteriota bacterium]